MRTMLLRFSFVSLLACLAWPQIADVPPETPEQKLDTVVGRHVAPVTEASLKECQVRLDQLQKWADKNYPIGKKLEADNAKLEGELAELSDDYTTLSSKEVKVEDENRAEVRLRVFVAFLAIGFGVFMAWGIVKAIRRWWPSSKQRRQLITLLLMATWVTIAAIVALDDPRLSYHPVNLAFSVLVYSLPALAFGGVGVWWFGRTKPEILW